MRLEDRDLQIVDFEGRSFFQIADLDLTRLFNYRKTAAQTDYYPVEKEKFEESYLNIGFNFYNTIDMLKENDQSTVEIEREVKFIYDFYYETYGQFLGDYFRNLYHILKFISNQKSTFKNIDGWDAKNYADILQSQLNFSELKLIYYNAYKFEKLKKYLNEFDFIENLHIDNLIDEQHAKVQGFGNIKEN